MCEERIAVKRVILYFSGVCVSWWCNYFRFVHFYSFLKDTGGIRGQASEEQQGHRFPRATVYLHHVQCHGGCQGPVSQTVRHGLGSGGRGHLIFPENLFLCFPNSGSNVVLQTI